MTRTVVDLAGGRRRARLRSGSARSGSRGSPTPPSCSSPSRGGECAALDRQPIPERVRRGGSSLARRLLVHAVRRARLDVSVRSRNGDAAARPLCARCTSTMACAARPTGDSATAPSCARGLGVQLQVPSAPRAGSRRRDRRQPAAGRATSATRRPRELLGGAGAVGRADRRRPQRSPTRSRRPSTASPPRPAAAPWRGWEAARRRARPAAARASRASRPPRTARRGGWSWREDASNEDERYARSRVRHGAACRRCARSTRRRRRTCCGPRRCCARRPSCSTSSSTRELEGRAADRGSQRCASWRRRSRGWIVRAPGRAGEPTATCRRPASARGGDPRARPPRRPRRAARGRARGRGDRGRRAGGWSGSRRAPGRRARRRGPSARGLDSRRGNTRARVR